MCSPARSTKPLGPWVLEEQTATVRKRTETHADAGLHALRHAFLTEAGEHADPFTLQYVAGHDNIKTTMSYVHPREEAVQKLFVRLGKLERPEAKPEWKGSRFPDEKSVQSPVQVAGGDGSVQNPVQWMEPSEAAISKLLQSKVLQSAEVVELADTPS
jgi:hypothetical protein